MKHNPCLACRMLKEDKNNSHCTKCDKRIGYVQQLEQELNFSMSYADTGFFARISIPLETNPPGRLKTVFGR